MEKFVGKEAVESSFHKLLPPPPAINRETNTKCHELASHLGKGEGKRGEGKT